VSVKVGIDAGTVAAGDDPRFGQLAIPAGAMMPYAAAAAPAGWLNCNGQAVSRTTFAGLFAAIGTQYGAGDGSTTFNVPDLRGRVPAGVDPGNGTGRLTASAGGGVSAAALANAGGEQAHTLSGGELPAHSHGVNDPGHAHGPSGPFQAYMGVYFSATGSSFAGGLGFNGDAMGATGAATTGISIQNAGGGASHNNTQPTVIVNYIIKT
jgi:microcystin-dependent protein